MFFIFILRTLLDIRASNCNMKKSIICSNIFLITQGSFLVDDGYLSQIYLDFSCKSSVTSLRCGPSLNTENGEFYI